MSGKGKGSKLETSLVVGPFSFSPPKGTINPGSKVEVSALFQAWGDNVYSETVYIQIAERDPRDNPDGIPYELIGESCIPGIDAQNIAAIFEEHKVSPLLDPFNPVNNEFGMREGAFNFGAVVPQLESTGESEERCSCGVKANLKFINPVRIPCTVDFSVSPQGNTGTKVIQSCPFSVKPSSPLIIPPHEYRYITVVFAPRAIQTYIATFEAIVQEGRKPETKGFTCQLRGEGSLPSLSLQVMFGPFSTIPIISFPTMLFS